uniref:Uncharacterized protein n=1 Tax=Molossus molossus TaxID=27622 RepID=A0A7J8F955_MOLMO|nr:hypothetical protein HJG59_008582 [Molossus molossus]
MPSPHLGRCCPLPSLIQVLTAGPRIGTFPGHLSSSWQSLYGRHYCHVCFPRGGNRRREVRDALLKVAGQLQAEPGPRPSLLPFFTSPALSMLSASASISEDSWVCTMQKSNWKKLTPKRK